MRQCLMVATLEYTRTDVQALGMAVSSMLVALAHGAARATEAFDLLSPEARAGVTRRLTELHEELEEVRDGFDEFEAANSSKH